MTAARTNSLIKPCPQCSQPRHVKRKYCEWCDHQLDTAVVKTEEMFEAAEAKFKAKQSARPAAPAAPVAKVDQRAPDAPQPDVAPKQQEPQPDVGKTEPAPVPVLEIAEGEYVAVRNFTAMRGAVMAVFREGQVISDYSVIKDLVAAGHPIMPKRTADGMICCPHCQKPFKPTAEQTNHLFSGKAAPRTRAA